MSSERQENIKTILSAVSEKLQKYSAIEDIQESLDMLDGIKDDICKQAALEQIDCEEILDNLSVSVYVSNAEGKTLYINKTYCDETGIMPQDVIGKKVIDIENNEKLYSGAITMEVIRQRKGLRGIATTRNTSAHFPAAVVRGHPVFDKDGNIKFVICTVSRTAVSETFEEVPNPKFLTSEQVFASLYGLTGREMALIEQLYNGASYTDIADNMFISINTVRTHIRNIYQKTDVNNQNQLVGLYKRFKIDEKFVDRQVIIRDDE